MSFAKQCPARLGFSLVLAALFVLLGVVALAADDPVPTATGSTTTVQASSTNGLKQGNGQLSVEVFSGGQWQIVDRLPFNEFPAWQNLTLPALAGNDNLLVRLSHQGDTAAHLDTILLNGRPAQAVSGQFEDEALAMRKLAAANHDLLNIAGRSLVFTFNAAPAARQNLTILARIEPDQISTIPFQFPKANNYRLMTPAAAFYSYRWHSNPGRFNIDGELDADIPGQPFMQVRSEPGTGHPAADTLAWIRNDADTLYVALDFAADNTMDGGKDYAKVYINTPTGLKRFKVSVPEQDWGRPGFTYTPQVDYQHKVYEFAIPAAALGLTDLREGDSLALAFALYGTAALPTDFPGRLDPDFGNAGVITTTFNGTAARFNDLVAQNDGQLLAAGYVQRSGFQFLALARYSADGVLDNTFGNNGVITHSFNLISGTDTAHGLAVQDDGGIVVVGHDNSSPALARLTNLGGLDPAFGNNGVVTTTFSGSFRDVALQSDGKIIAAGQISNTFAVVRYDGTGTLDSSFGSGGLVTTTFGSQSGSAIAYAVAVQNDGKIVAAGQSAGDDFALVRYTLSGTLDASFGISGVITTTFGGNDVAHDLALQEDGKIIAAGKTSLNSDFALARYTLSGTLDADFGSGGLVTTDFGSDDDEGHAVALQDDGKIVLAGNTPGNRLAVARYNTDGSLDANFGTSGRANNQLAGSGYDGGYALVIQEGDLPRLVAAGYAEAQQMALLAAYTEAPNCFATIDGNLVYQSANAAAVQSAVDAAAPGNTIKLAGTCAGVKPRASLTQTVYLSQSLTLQGGFTTTNWLTPNLTAYPTVLDAEDQGRVVYIPGGYTVTLTGLTITGGNSDAGGDAAFGAGIYNNGRLTVSNSLITGNVASSWGGGLINFNTVVVSATRITHNEGEGAALFNQTDQRMQILNSTIDTNIANNGAVQNRGVLSITNSTVSGNTGIGLSNYVGNPQVTISHTTIASNTGFGLQNNASGGVGVVFAEASLIAKNSIDCVGDGTFNDQGYNLVGDGTCISAGSSFSGDPLLAPLADDTLAHTNRQLPVHLLRFGSPALNAIPVGNCELNPDQRGISRPQNEACDVGAVENQPFACYASLNNSTSTDFAGPDARTLQKAVDAAQNGDLIKVAGTCAGVKNIDGYTQTLYIGTDNLTIRGGYTTTNWLTPSLTVNPTVLDARSAGRVVFVPYDVTINNTTLDGFDITGGNAVSQTVGTCGSGGTNGGGGICLGSANGFRLLNSRVYSNVAASGGGIYRHGGGNTLLLSNTLVYSNRARSDVGGGIHQRYNELELVNSTVRDNQSQGEGGGVYVYLHTVRLQNSVLRENHSNSNGGGLATSERSELSIEINDSQIVSNTAASNGGGLYLVGGSTLVTTSSLTGNIASNGGGIYNTKVLALNGGQIVNHTIPNNGAGLHNSGSGQVSLSRTLIARNVTTNTLGQGAGIYNSDSGQITSTAGQITNNTAQRDGGGIHNDSNSGVITFNESTISHNAARYGGGIRNFGHVTLSNSRVLSNTASLDGGGISTWGNFTATRSLIAYNQAVDDGGGLQNTENATLINTTISHNEGQSSGNGVGGGGIYQEQDGPAPVLHLIHSTVVSNVSAKGGDGMFLISGQALLSATLIADNDSENCAGGGSYVSQGYNLEDSTTCNLTATTDLPNTTPQLFTLGNSLSSDRSDSPLLTHGLLPGSPAVDAVPTANCTTSDDQRGVSRPQSTGCDIGAHEVQVVGPITVTITADVDVDDDECSLREAIVAANTDLPYHGCLSGLAADIINMTTISGTISLGSDLPTITDRLRLAGPGAANLSIDAQNTHRSFLANGAGVTLEINDLSLINLIDPGVSAANDDLTIRRSSIAGTGDAVLALSGNVTVTHSTIAAGDYGVVAAGGRAFVSHSTITAISVDGVYADDKAIIRNSEINAGVDGAYSDSSGVEISNSRITAGEDGADAADFVLADNSTITATNNGLFAFGGNITVTNSTVTSLSDDGLDADTGQITVSNSRIYGAEAGIDTDTGAVVVTASLVIGNQDGINAAGNASVYSSTVTGNTLAGVQSGGTASVINSIITNSGSDGINALTVNLRQSTITGNGGDGVQSSNQTTVRIHHSTIVNNDGYGINNAAGTTVISHTLLARNDGVGSTRDVNTSLSLSSTYNLLGNGDGSGLTDGANGNQLGSTGALLDPLLAAVDDYGRAVGGATRSHALLPGSPAIDAIPIADCTLSHDQRGVSRPQLSGCDIGAFESRGFTLSISGGNNQQSEIGTAFAEALAITVTAVISSEPVGPGGVISFTGPASGAGITTANLKATTNAGGNAATNVTANSDIGSYPVEVTAAGITESLSFDLENITFYSLLTATTGDGNGRIELVPGGGVYTNGTTVQLSAVPESGNTFVGWRGDRTGTANPTTILMSEPRSVTATFRAPAGVTVAPTLVSASEPGATEDYYLVLDTKPTQVVTITISPDDQTTVSTSTIVFSPLTWNVPQTITVGAVDDDQDEGQHNGLISHSSSSADSLYNDLTIASVSVSISDNDSPCLCLTPINVSVTEGGSNSQYAMRLTTEPTDRVTVTLNITTSDIVANPTRFIFTRLNWSDLQTVTVSAVDDAVVEATEVFTIDHQIESNDIDYTLLPPREVRVTVNDNDTAGISLSRSLVAATEGDSGDSYNLVLLSQPTAPVTITVSSGGQVALTPGQIIFTAATWDTPQTVTVAAVDDADVEGNHNDTIIHQVNSSDPFYDGLDVATVAVNLTDNDSAGLSITPINLNVTEGSANVVYNLVLTTEPTAAVTVTMNITSRDIRINPAEIVFTPATWDDPQSVSVSAVDDAEIEVTETARIEHTVSSSDVAYDGLAANAVSVSINDNDVAGVTVNPTTISASEPGATEDYSLVLNAIPTAPVTITIHPDAQTTVNTNTLVFTALTWDQAQTVTVGAVDDDLAEGQHSGLITHTLASNDSNYSGLTVDPVNVTISDNDSPCACVTPINLTVREGGPSAFYRVRLTTEPAATVTVTLHITRTDLRAEPVNLVYTALTWSDFQTVTVAAADDAFIEGTHSAIITHSVSSADPAYAAVQPSNVTVTILDNDVPPTYTLSLTSTGPGSGNINASPNLLAYEAGTAVTLTAIPDPGSFFGGWSGSVTTANNPLLITMDSNKVITATFLTTPPITVTLTMNTVGNGTVLPGTTTQISGTTINLSATPAAGWQFLTWSGDLTGTANPAALLMNRSKTVTATFSTNDPASLFLPLILK